jgi:type II secretory pathway predicted ATPase ExeA
MKNAVMDFYGLSCMPFGKEIVAESMFRSNNLENAVAMLNLGVGSEDLLLLTGPVGSGKSCALRVFAAELDQNRHTLVYLRGTFLSHAELLKAVLSGLHVEPPFSATKARALYYKTIAEHPKLPVVIIDDAQDLKESAILSLKALVNHEQDSRHRITFVLCGQSELKDILQYSKFEAIRQRIRLSHCVGTLSLAETCHYVDHCIKLTGRTTSLFSDAAKSEIHKRSQGIPRKVNAIGLRAILNGAANAKAVLDASDIPVDD